MISNLVSAFNEAWFLTIHLDCSVTFYEIRLIEYIYTTTVIIPIIVRPETAMI